MNNVYLNYKYHIFLISFLTYIFLGTGFYSDDFIEVITRYHLDIDNIIDFLYVDTSTHHVAIFNLFSSYFFRFWFILFGDNQSLYFIPKVVISYVAIILIYKFFSQYLQSRFNAFFIAVLFVLFPLHDATNYWYSALKYTIVPAIILYGYYLVNQERYKTGFIVLCIGSFYGFSSPAYSLGLSTYFLLKKEFKKFVIAVIPGLFYICFYFYITIVSNAVQGRIESELSILKLFKQYLLQIGTFFDTVIGLSFWLKLIMSISQLTLISGIIGVVLISLFWRFYSYKKEKLDGYLLVALLLVVLFGLGIFSLTGNYPQMAFNLGDRVTIYSSLLISFIIITFLVRNKLSATIVFSIFIFSVLGLSDHWKSWNKTQLQVIENIKTNKDLQDFDRTKQLFVTYNQYSKLGSIAHIELFAQGMADKIFKYATSKDYKISTLNQRFTLQENYLIDKKYNTKIVVDNIVYIYDSKENKLLTIKKENLQRYIKSLPKDTRHWLLLLDKDNFVIQIVLKLMPRLEYAL